MGQPLILQELTSHLELYPTPVCHLLPSQFEKQWSATATLFEDPVELALQFLGLWHLPSDHALYLTHRPCSSSYLHLDRAQLHYGKLPNLPLQPWGVSPAVKRWASGHSRQLAAYPPLEVIEQIHDKRFIEQWRGPLDPQLPQASWIDRWELIEQLRDHYPHLTWLAKRPWSAAGRGNLLICPSRPLPKSLLQQEFERQGGWLLQPFVTRRLDFSSLWWIDPSGQSYLFATTRMKLSPKGRYLGCYLGEQLFVGYEGALAEHFEQAQPLLSRCAELGYWGWIGLDAMLYHPPCNPSALLCRIIEINARQTLAMHLESARRQLFGRQMDGTFEATLTPAQQLTSQSLLPPIEGAFNLRLHRL